MKCFNYRMTPGWFLLKGQPFTSIGVIGMAILINVTMDI